MAKQAGLPPSRFGTQLRRVREEKGLTQKQVGERAGIHPNTVARLERGEVEPSWRVVLAFTNALEVDCTAFSASADEQPTQPEPEPAKNLAPKKPAAKKPPKKK